MPHPSISASTPLMRQYEAIKRQHPDAIVLFRMGDFFETFGEDAVITARVCGIVLTKRNNGAAGEVPLAGFPHHQLDTYLPKLVAAGYRVAVCEQLEDPKLARGLVKRGVVEIVTPGVALYDKVLEASTNRYVAALIEGRHEWGIAYADASTGEFVVGQLSEQELVPLLETLAPAEIVIPKPLTERIARLRERLTVKPATTRIEPWYFDAADARRLLSEHFRTSSLKGFGIEHLDVGLQAAGALFRYISDAQLGRVEHLRSIRLWHNSDVMLLDAGTRRNLDLVPSADGRVSLFTVMDSTVTPMGARLLKQWLTVPLRRRDVIEWRLDMVAQLRDNHAVREQIARALSAMGDFERTVTKICTARATPRDVRNLAIALAAIPVLRALHGHVQSPLAEFVGQLPDFAVLRQRIEAALVDEPSVQLGTGNVFRPGYSAELDAALDALLHGKEWLARYQEQLRAETQIPSLKLGYNNVFGYYIEVTHAHRAKVPAWFERKQTLTNAERYTTPELRQLESRIAQASDDVERLEHQLFAELRAEIAEHAADLQALARSIATLDVLQSYATVAQERRYVRPVLRDDGVLRITAGRHPVVETILPVGQHYQPNSTVLGTPEERIHIITGPNMAGKSCYLRQVGLIVLLAHAGSFVPAEEAEIPLVDRIFTRVGAQDNLTAGESTFLVEMQEAAAILNNATRDSLILLDEVGRGTATREGIAIAWAIVEYIYHAIGAKTLFATHYRELTELATHYPGIRLYQAEVKEVGSTLLFPHRIIPGVADHSFGIHVAQMAGVPSVVVERARQILQSLEQQSPSATQPVHIAATRTVQLSIFEQAADPLREFLCQLDPERMTPLQALQTLTELVQRSRH
ncbi:MAG: DNA mismatch repair protein MutS [Bacteroidota bacterium]|nr:DNA mismatch repair protein MutS [Candidatus Kapabacteria bacterium]MDW8075764.1 DNA mismatch repair protein MutS [Bacteroidota bacterium]